MNLRLAAHPAAGAAIHRIYKPGELPSAFQGLRVLRYEEPVAKPDFAPRPLRLARYAAEKPMP